MRLHHRLPNTIEGKRRGDEQQHHRREHRDRWDEHGGTTLGRGLTDLLATGIAEVLAQRAQAVGEIDAALGARGEELVRARRRGFGRDVGRVSERFGLADAVAHRREHRAELVDHHSLTPVDDALRCLHRTCARAHVHGEELVHRVELEPDPLAPIGDGPLESTALARRPEHDPGQAETDGRERAMEDEDAEPGSPGTERQHLHRHAGAVLVGSDVGEPRLAQRARRAPRRCAARGAGRSAAPTRRRVARTGGRRSTTTSARWRSRRPGRWCRRRARSGHAPRWCTA